WQWAARIFLSSLRRRLDSHVEGEAADVVFMFRTESKRTGAMNDAGGSFLSGDLPPEAEEAIALQFAALHKDDLKYVPAWGWLCWTGSHWRLDNTLKVIDLVRALCRDVAELEPSRFLKKSIASAKTVFAVERLAR